MPLDIFISSIEKERDTSRVENSDVTIDYGAVYSDRDIELKLYIQAQDTRDYRLLRDVVYDALDRTRYVSEDYQAGKLHSINVDSRYIPERLNQIASTVDVSCTSRNTPFAESIASTQDIERNGTDANSHLWGFGMGIIDEPASRKYTFKNANNFKVFNAGSVPVHPFEQELKITITNIKGANSSFELLNKTNGSFIKITNGLKVGDTIVVDGPTITRNSAQYLRHTTRNFIWLSEAYNNFEVIGADSADIEFDFKFYYK